MADKPAPDQHAALCRALPQWQSWNRIQWIIITFQLMLIITAGMVRVTGVLDLMIYACIPFTFVACLVTLRKRKRCQRSLQALDFLVCPRCLYDLRQLEEAMRCPECGQAIGPEQNVVNWRIKLSWWGSR